ncbi:dynein beta chain, ciliary-like [Bombus pascuorum]|uniref:dynein beta chain, ciliary-like n=1 Tax=Bombus pascuorum TaxID=65598 RepID=UPI00298E295C|nr:dynein beta chain, ciliary-like [Bombus pascuorum]
MGDSSNESGHTVCTRIRLSVHEATRVYSDKLINAEDKKAFQQLLKESLRKNISEMVENIVFAGPIIYCHFAEGIGEPKYMPIKDWQQLTKLLDEALVNYNELVAAMNLVLFEGAMYQVCQINRILESPRGNALLVGVGGSGKQSLSSLASFIAGLEKFKERSTGVSHEDGTGRSSTSTTDNNIKSARKLILSNGQVALNDMANHL